MRQSANPYIFPGLMLTLGSGSFALLLALALQDRALAEQFFYTDLGLFALGAGGFISLACRK